MTPLAPHEIATPSENEGKRARGREKGEGKLVHDDRKRNNFWYKLLSFSQLLPSF
jgi:hypothetical protein